jgi:hypothetical protein
VAVVGSVQQIPNRGRFSFILLLLGAHDFKLVAWGVCDFEDWVFESEHEVWTCGSWTQLFYKNSKLYEYSCAFFHTQFQAT